MLLYKIAVALEYEWMNEWILSIQNRILQFLYSLLHLKRQTCLQKISRK